MRGCTRLAWLIFVFASAASGCATNPQVPPVSSAAEYAIYSASLEKSDSQVVRNQGGAHRVSAHADTFTSMTPGLSRDWVYDAAERMDLPDGLFEDFRRRNSERLCLNPELFETAAPVVLIARNSTCPGTPAGQVPTPRDSILITFSRVGFTANGDQALVLEVFECGDRCGWVGLSHLGWRSGEWDVLRYEQVALF